MLKSVIRQYVDSKSLWRFASASLVATIAIAVLTFALTSLFYESLYYIEVKRTHDLLAKRVSREISLFFEEARAQLAGLAHVHRYARPARHEMDALLNDMALDSTRFDSIALFERDGRMIGASALEDDATTFPDTDAFKNAIATGAPQSSGVELTANRFPFVRMAAPFKAFGEVDGVVFAVVSLRRLWWWIDQINSEGKTVLSVVNSGNGIVIVDQSKGGIGKIHPGWNQRESGTATAITEDRDNYLSAYPLDTVNLTIVTQTPRAGFLSHLYHIRYQLITVAGVLVLFALLLSTHYAWIQATPVVAAIERIDMFAEDPSTRFPTKKTGGLGELARAFNRMADTMHGKNREIIRTGTLTIIGRVSSALAHDLRHGLHLIQNMIYFLEDPDGETKRVLNRTIYELTQKITELLEYTRSSRMEPTETPVAELLAEVFAQSRYSEKAEKVKLNRSGDIDNVIIQVDPVKTRSAFVNIVRNSVEAGASVVDVHVRLVDGKGVFTFTDNGTGIPEEVTADLFEPFVTTKRKGFGIGLAAVRAIAEGHDGTVTIGPIENGAGTVCVVTLPNAYRKAETEALVS